MASTNSSAGQSGVGVSAPINYDSPSAAAINNMLGLGSFDASLDSMDMGVGGMALPRPTGDEERQKRLDECVQILMVGRPYHCGICHGPS